DGCAFAIAAPVLCATIAGPGVIKQSDLDAKPVNLLAGAGVLMALGLTLYAWRRTGTGPPAARSAVDGIALRGPPGRGQPGGSDRAVDRGPLRPGGAAVDLREPRLLRRRRPRPPRRVHVEEDPARGRPSHAARRPPGKPRGPRRLAAGRDGAAAAARPRADAADAAA